MPHVIVKLLPDRTEQQKAAPAEDIIEVVRRNTGASNELVSIAIEEVPADEWMENVYRPEIPPAMDRLYKKPSYAPF